VDPSGFPSNFFDSTGSGGVWQGSHHHPPPPNQTNVYSPYPPSRLHPHPMAPRDPHFLSQSAPRHFRPSAISPEYRLYDLNKRLLTRNEDSDQHWWELFANQFFEDDATINISIYLDEEPKRFTVNRTLIPRFFRTLVEGDVSEVYFHFKQSKEHLHQPIVTFDCEQGSLIMQLGRPSFIKSCTDGHFTIDFTFDDLMRIKSWNWVVKQHYEMIPRSVVAIPTDNPTYLEQLSRNFIRYGLPTPMINFLRLCEILQPMHELMSRQRTSGFSARDCLRTILQKPWPKTPIETRQPKKTPRKRKSNSSTISGGTESPVSSAPTTPTKKRSSANSLLNPNANSSSSTPGDVMIVGEPSLMGGEMDDDDERFITRLENNQYDPNVSNSDNSSKSTFGTNSSLIKREQTSYPNSPALPSIFNPNGENSLGNRRISSTTTNPSPITTNSSTHNENKQEPQTPPVTPQQTSVIG